MCFKTTHINKRLDFKNMGGAIKVGDGDKRELLAQINGPMLKDDVS